MKAINVKDAVNLTLCHDITKIIPGEYKGVAYKKGHVIKEEDIPILRSLGKEHIYVWENEAGMLHENDAAMKLKDITSGSGLTFGEVKEGKIEYFAAIDGLLKINKYSLVKINSLKDIILSTIHNNTVVKKGDKVAATKVVPLTIEEEKIKEVELIVSDKIIEVIPIKKKKIAIITTGSEIYYGMIKDAFGPVLKSKFDEYKQEIIGTTFLPDDATQIEQAILDWIKKGAELVICTGGMSVDPDDVTPTAIKNTGADVITYGTPILPGAMLLLAYKGSVSILGLPGSVIYNKRTVFDLILPRVLADERLTFRDIAEYAHGGLCMNCEVCTFPKCGFGKN